MSDLDPTGPSQPTQSQAYTNPGNPASKEPAEAYQASQNARSNEEFAAVDRRIPQNQASEDEAIPSSLGRGVRGAGPGEEALGKTEEDVGRHNELDGEQMSAPGEGKVRDAVEGKDGRKGASGQQEDLAADMERKKAEQASAREAMKQQREKNVDVGGVLGQRGGPANPVGKDNYPNTSD